MNGPLTRWFVAVYLLGCFAALATRCHAADDEGAVARSMLDDAALWAVAFVDNANGWAVGDRGVIWRTADGGQSWQLQRSGAEGVLRCAHFADPENGWVAGGQYRPYLGSTKGILLRTYNGGQTWETDKGLLMPAIRMVKFFGGPQGWAFADPSALFPSGVFSTDDGGRSWIPLADREPSEWTVGDSAEPLSAALAGARGARGIVRERKLEAWQQPEYGLREPRALRVTGVREGWLAGDGGLLLRTRDGGRSWQPPAQEPSAAEQFDFRALDARGDHVWVAGSPGTRVWHSADKGGTWESLPTGQQLPIHALTFVDAEHGWAVGALGMILATTDGGRTWQKQRGARQRAALLAVYSDPERAPLEALARLAANEGFVTAVELIARRDAEPDTGTAALQTDRDRAAFVQLGVSAVERAWGFPLRQQGVHSTVEQCVESWNRMYGGRGVERLEEHLVRRIRTWRPDVILTSAASPGGDDPLGHLVNQVVLRAAADAASADKFPEQFKDAGLTAWSVKKVGGSLPPGKPGTINVNTAQLAPRLTRSLADYSAAPRGLFVDRFRPPPAAWGFRLYHDTIPQGMGQQDFFSGINLPPAGEARRELPAAGRAGLDVMRQIAEKHRNVQAILAHAERSGRGGAALLAQIGDLTRGLDADTAGQALFEVAQTYYQDGHWDFAAATFQLLTENFPGHPLAAPAFAWQVQYWASGEAACRARVGNNARTPPAVAAERSETLIPAAIPATPDATIALTGGRDTAAEPKDLAARRASAAAAAQVLERVDAQCLSDMHVQFPLAVSRRRQEGREAERFYATLVGTRPHDGWWSCARGEQWLAGGGAGEAPKTTALVRRGVAKPKLDGELDDELWRDSERLELTSPLSDDAEWPATVMLAYDEQFLYVAIASRAAPQAHYASEQRTRARDADLSPHDRVEILLDIDRDFTTFYRLSVDHRGWTAEDCWGDATWNPRWFVAAARSDSGWTVEVAIPLAELTPEPVTPKTVWALGLQRVVPNVGFQSWSRPATVAATPQGFGYLIFE